MSSSKLFVSETIFQKSWSSMAAMGTVLIEQQLLELFPHIEEEFILGLYDAYKEENPDLDEMVTIVFSYDYPPLKKLTNDSCKLQTEESGRMQTHSDNLSLEVNSKIVVDRALKEDELIVSSSRAINTNETNTQIFQQNHNETEDNCGTNPKVQSCDNNRLTETKTLLVINKIFESPDTKRDPISSNKIINEYPKEFNFSIGEEYDEYENSSENEVKLLFFELPFRNDNYLQNQKVISQLINVNVNYNDHAVLEKEKLDSTNEIQSIDNHTSPGDKESSNDDLNSEVTSTSLLSNTESIFSNSFITKSKISQADSRSDEEPCLSISSGMPVLIPNQSETSALCTSSLTANEFCSPESPESSKTALLDGSEILHEKLTNPIGVRILSMSKTGPLVKDIRPLCSPFNTPESKFALLRKIFPDADPEYLHCQSENLINSDDVLLFISNNMDEKMYPKRNKLEESAPEVLGFDCTVEEFLQYIPDPATEFQSDQYIRTDYKENAELYLKSR